MPSNGWSTIYISVPTALKERVEAAAAADDRKVAKWLERLLIEYFANKDAACCASPSTTYQPSNTPSSGSESSSPESSS